MIKRLVLVACGCAWFRTVLGRYKGWGTTRCVQERIRNMNWKTSKRRS